MMDTMNRHSVKEAMGMQTAILYILVSVFFSTVGQLLLKGGMNKLGSVTLSLNGLIPTLWRMAINRAFSLGWRCIWSGRSSGWQPFPVWTSVMHIHSPV